MKKEEKKHLPVAQETLSTSLGPSTTLLCPTAALLCLTAALLCPTAALCLSSSGGGGGRGVREDGCHGGDATTTNNFKLRSVSNNIGLN
jgi:hypothetical protein